MSEFILRSNEVGSEHLLNRQTAKIKYLQQEKSQLKEYISELEALLKLNKEALKINISSNNNNNTKLY